MADLPSEFVPVPVDFFATSEYKKDPDGKFILGILLAVRHSSASEGEKAIKYTSTSTYYQRGNSRAKTVGNKPYDRYMIYGDVLTPGKCFVIINPKHGDSIRLFRRVARAGNGVGTLVAACEPDPIVQTMGENSSLYIVENPTDYYQLNNDFEQVVPQVSPVIPPANHTAWFCHHNINSLSFHHVTLQDASCSGTFCDKQQAGLSPHQSCGCLYKSLGHANDKVLDYDVIFPVPASVDQAGEITVSHTRSYNTTKLMFKDENFSTIDMDIHQKSIREAVEKIANCVNNNGGWTIIGWVRTGKVKDASSDANTDEALESLEPRFHVSYLFPTDKSIVQCESFKDCQFKLD
jgi:hypothetical protein